MKAGSEFRDLSETTHFLNVNIFNLAEGQV